MGERRKLGARASPVDSADVNAIRRRAARVWRGDVLRDASRVAARLLPSPASGNVWTGTGYRMRQALAVTAPDLHQLRGEVLDAILAAISPAVPVLSPPIPRLPRRLAVREEDAGAVLAALRALPPHWDVQRSRIGDVLSVRPRFAVAGRELERTADLELRVAVMARRGPVYQGTVEGSPGQIVAEQWEQTARESLRAEHRRDGPPAPQMPIDVVYTWVDGADPAWRARRDAALGETGTLRAAAHPSATDESRFTNSDELRYSLRSLHRNAHWVRRIHIVTDGQVPTWLRHDDARIRIVDHREILDGSRFNSHAIESALHRIPGLAEHYLYLNDDVMFGRIAHPGDFFAAKGVSRFFPSDLPIDAGPVSSADPPIMAAAKNGRDLLSERFGMEVRTKIRHTVHPQLRSVAAQIEQENPEVVARTRAALFRSSEDLSLAASLHHWYAYSQGRAVPSGVNYLYVDLAAPEAAQALDALESLRRYDTFCLNTEESALSPRMRVELTRFLEKYYPDPAPWELLSAGARSRGRLTRASAGSDSTLGARSDHFSNCDGAGK